MRRSALCLSLLTLAACAKQYLPPDSGPRATLSIDSQETRGTVGYLTPEECRKRLGAHTIVALSAVTEPFQTQLPAEQDAVLAYDYDQPEHLGLVGPLTHCHVAFAFHPIAGGSYVLAVMPAEECRLGINDIQGKPVPGASFAADRCHTLTPPLIPPAPGMLPPP